MKTLCPGIVKDRLSTTPFGLAGGDGGLIHRHPFFSWGGGAGSQQLMEGSNEAPQEEGAEGAVFRWSPRPPPQALAPWYPQLLPASAPGPPCRSHHGTQVYSL